MGAIWFTHAELVDKVVEYVGFKSGLALTPAQLTPHIPDDYKKAWATTDDMIRLRSEEFQELIAETLDSLGVANSGYVPFFSPLAAISRKDPSYSAMFDDLKAAVARCRKNVNGSEQIDFPALLDYADGKYEGAGYELAIQLAVNPQAVNNGPWGVFREIAWQDIRELDDLFHSENLDTFHGKYFDQRFIDYLAENPSDLKTIQWRQFEGLTAEYFEKAGYTVKIGPGRDDDNIDVRAWARGNIGPPTILIQCKRQKQTVDKVVVKALYADVIHEKAQSGMIVTTSSLAPGAAKMRTARGYPIHEADRAKVLKWIEAMRTQPIAPSDPSST